MSRFVAGTIALAGFVACSKSASNGIDAGAVAYVSLPNAMPPLILDDLRFAPQIDKVLVPAGSTLYLVDPASAAVTQIGAFGGPDAGVAPDGAAGRPGTSSAVEGDNVLYAIDVHVRTVDMVDPSSGSIVATATLAGQPDYVRFVSNTGEVWVTDPHGTALIEVFKPTQNPPRLVRTASISTPGGPEQLEIDHPRSRGYVHAGPSQTMTLGIDLETHRVVSSWTNGCGTAKGLVIDETSGFLVIGCSDGTIKALDALHGGAVLSSIGTNDGVDLIAYAPSLRHVYVPTSHAQKLWILGLSTSGVLSLLGSLDTGASDGHSAVADSIGNAYVGNGAQTRIAIFKDPFPASH